MTIELELDEETIRKLRLLGEYHEISQRELLNHLIRQDLAQGDDSQILRSARRASDWGF